MPEKKVKAADRCGGCRSNAAGIPSGALAAVDSALDLGLFIETKQKAILDRTALTVFLALTIIYIYFRRLNKLISCLSPPPTPPRKADESVCVLAVC